MALPTPPPYTNPIPNNPFYSPEVFTAQGAYYPMTVGSGLSVNPATAFLTSTGGGGGGVTSITAGPGIAITGSTGNVTIINAGVLDLVAGSGISITELGGTYTIASTGGEAVPSATPLVEGIVYGCTDCVNFNYGLGDNIFGALTSGQYNIAIGGGALNSADTGTSNTAIGIGALYGTTSGIQNVAIGQQALFSLTTGGLNTAVGSQTLQNATGDANTALGNYAGNVVTSGCSNILIGNQAGGVGPGALNTGSNNVVIGNCVSPVSNSGDCQLAIGVNTMCWLTGRSTGAIKPGAGIIDCANSCGTANQVLASNAGNAVCWRTIAAATPTNLGLTYAYVNGPAPIPNVSKENASFGYDAMGAALTSGESNTAVGNSAANQMTTGSYNTAVGQSAGFWFASGSFNTALGSLAVFGADGAAESCNTGVGYQALANTGGSGNVALGYQAGCQSGCSNVGGDNNSFIGNQAGCDLTSGSQNVVIGCGVQAASPTGSCQLAIGFSATNNWLTGNSTKAIKPGAGIIDCTNSCGTANYVLTSQGNAVQWKSVSSGIAAPNYGNFINTLPQIPNALNTGQPVEIGTIVAANNFSLGSLSTSAMVAAVAGVYNLQFSLQITSIAAGGGHVEVWLVKDGLAVADTNTRFSIKNINEYEFAALNYVISLGAGQYLELYWATDNLNIRLAAPASTMGGPKIPSAIITIVPVGA